MKYFGMVLTLGLAACGGGGGGADEPAAAPETPAAAVSVPAAPSVAVRETAAAAQTDMSLARFAGRDPWHEIDQGVPLDPALRVQLGAMLFDAPAPQSNGRSCASCHSPLEQFALTPAGVERRYRLNPSDPLFRALDADDFGADFRRLRRHALVRISLPLPTNVALADAPAQRTVQVWRAVPTVLNTALTAPFQADGRLATLEVQAASAFVAHAESTFQPQPEGFRLVAEFERAQFSSEGVRRLAQGGTLPQDTVPRSADQLAGQRIYQARCVFCHGADGNLPRAPSYFDITISQFNRPGLPVQRFVFTLPDGSRVERASADPGRALITGRIEDFDKFETPGLRGIARTAPYFHDNSAATLAEMLQIYNRHFDVIGQSAMSAEEQRVLVKYLEIL